MKTMKETISNADQCLTEKAQPRNLIPHTITSLRQVYEILKVVENHVAIMENHDGVHLDVTKPEPGDTANPQPPLNIELEQVLTMVSVKASHIASRIENAVQAIYGVG